MIWVFRWNSHNVGHLAEHGVSSAEAEAIVRRARAPYPRAIENGKFVVWGQGEDGYHLQVIFIYSPPTVVYVIHARPLNDSEKRRYRRQRR